MSDDDAKKMIDAHASAGKIKDAAAVMVKVDRPRPTTSVRRQGRRRGGRRQGGVRRAIARGERAGYPGGVAKHIQNARALGGDSKDGKNLIEGGRRACPRGRRWSTDPRNDVLEKIGKREAEHEASRGGRSGERLGYSGIKVELR